MDEKNIIAENIIYYRKRNGWSQLELAEKLQYSNKNISKWERAETVPSVFTLKRLSEIFGITLDALVSPRQDQTEKQNESEQATAPQIKKKRPKQSYKHKLVYLFLAIAILYAVVFVCIFIMGIANVKRFNYWLLFLYATPLVALAVAIFNRCTLKRVDYISVSLVGWLIAFSIFLSFKSYKNIGYVFFLALGYEFIILCIGILIDYKYLQRIKQARKIKKQKKLISKAEDEKQRQIEQEK